MTTEVPDTAELREFYERLPDYSLEDVVDGAQQFDYGGPAESLPASALGLQQGSPAGDGIRHPDYGNAG